MAVPGWDAEEFGQTWAPVYDEVFAHLAPDTTAATVFLTALLPRGARVLELGVGTGRLAIPLADARMVVTGIDASARMLQHMAAKAGGERVTGVLGDMADPPVDGPFDAVLIAFNTLYALPDQDSQIRCLSSAAALLDDAGVMVIELAVPQPWRMRTADVPTGEVHDDVVALEVGDHDPVTQTIRSAKVVISERVGIRTLPLRMRYTYPPELDLMARLAGLALATRWGGWDHRPFDRDSTTHVSLYRRVT